ncbi:MAG: hypothetical protein IPQ08_01020 [Chitinophagaceae bacterium]|jgi:hypothetical protein|nr:hypothetical protein [Chitinophagaceae bacterium]
MADNLKDILSNLNPDVDQETLMLYLQGKLSEEKKNEIEKQLLQDDFNEDAFEGLESFKDKEQLSYMVDALNRDLKKKTAKKKARREKLRIKDQPWIYISILILLLLIAIAVMFIMKIKS